MKRIITPLLLMTFLSLSVLACKDMQLETGKENPSVTTKSFKTNVAEESNCYIIAPGEQISIPVNRAYAVWSQLLNTELTGEDTSAELVWEDTKGLITSVNLNNDEILQNAFITIKSGNALSGNAVVALKFDGVIKYSWHIWVVNYDPEERYHSLNGNIFMSRNLGALSEEPDNNTDTYGVNYQWGRKDPFPTAEQNTSGGELRPIYDKDGNEIVITYFTDLFGLNDILENPTLVPYRLDASGGYDSWNSDEGTKTLLDPCPTGWRVPVYENEINPWEGFSEHSTFDSQKKGFITSDGIWYPLPGICSFPAPNLSFQILWQGFKGEYWSSSIATLKAGNILSLSILGVSMDQEDVLRGLPIRCMKE